jgi:Fe-S oxidoreductase
MTSRRVKTLAAAVREGREIVVPGPTRSSTCSSRSIRGWTAQRTPGWWRATRRDLFEYLAGLHAEGKLDTRFAAAPGKIAYQLRCHLRAQNLGTKSADVLWLTGAEVETIEG